MKMIEYSGKDRGKFFKISDESFEKVSKYKWYLSYRGYATTSIRQPDCTRNHLILKKKLLKNMIIKQENCLVNLQK